MSKTYLTFHDDFPSYFTEACLRVVFVQDFSYGPPHRSTASDRNFGVRPANILLRTGVRCHGGGFSIASNPSREQLRNSSTRVSRSHSIISPIAYYFCGEIRIRRRLKRIVFVRVHTYIYIFFLSFLHSHGTRDAIFRRRKIVFWLVKSTIKANYYYYRCGIRWQYVLILRRQM